MLCIFFFILTSPSAIYTLSLHDALPILFGFERCLSRKPPVTGNAEHIASFDHFPTRLWEGRDAKFHPARDGFTVPGLVSAAAILFPNSHPRKVSRSPDVANGNF